MNWNIRSLPWSYILLAFAVFCANRLDFNASGGEEQYLAFARQFVNPDWIPESFALTEFAGSRILFQWLIGPLMELFSFDAMVFSMRLLNFFLLSIPVGMLLKRLEISLPLAFVFLQVFAMGEQNLLGGEWVVRSFEPKSVAYIFVFFALYYFAGRAYWQMALHLALASYFHILVGGWMMVILGLVLLIEGPWKKAFVVGGIYLALMLPFLFYLLPGYFGSAAPAADVNLDWVYVYHRLPHHLGIWKNVDYFMKSHFVGATLTALLFAVGLLWRRWLPANLARLNTVMLLCFLINILFVGVAAIDHFVLDDAGALGLKFYPFRSNSIGFFIALLLGLHFCWRGTQLLPFQRQAVIGLSAVMVVLVVVHSINGIKESVEYFERDPAYRNMCAYIQQHTHQEDVFFILAPYWGDSDYISFTRRTDRENYYVPKFVAAEKVKLAEWYDRYKLYMKVRRSLEHLPMAAKKYGVTHLLDGKKRNDENLVFEHQEGDYYLYRVTK